jgi:hypothetical protein
MSRTKSIDIFTTKIIEHPIYGKMEVKVCAPKKEYNKRIDKTAKRSLDDTVILYDVTQEEDEANKMFAGISQIYVEKMYKKKGIVYTQLSNKMTLENCTTREIKMGEATRKYLNGKKCFDFVDLDTGESKLKKILPEINTQDSEDVHSQEISGFMQTKRLTSIDIAHVFKDNAFSKVG